MTFQENDTVTKGNETGIVVRRVGRSGRPYLTVKILTGPRTGLGEFPEWGWRLVDADGRTAVVERPVRDPETAAGYAPGRPYQPIPDDDDLPF